ncbi:hypothetical protein PUN28_009321 [Cardiocondyla obscurior]|uniref:riboflavin kinase n=1 Tax=Cardiocondyla obscurior TaxID=286306 RepID=A0AAW2FUT2_9HYME
MSRMFHQQRYVTYSMCYNVLSVVCHLSRGTFLSLSSVRGGRSEERGSIVKGFGRGSKELGIPTANLLESVISSLPKELNTGIYYGWASLRGEVYKMVASIGWNPYYKNEKKSLEVHLIHTFPEDFYGEELKVIITGYIRPEKDFSSLGSSNIYR